MNTFVIDKEALKKGWGAEGQFWFSFLDYTVIEDFTLALFTVPEHMDNEEFFELHDIIPYFNVKRYELAKQYVLSLNNKKISEKFENLEDKDIVEYFWKYYNAYPALFENFEEYQNKFILEKAENWCRDNKINYTVEL